MLYNQPQGGPLQIDWSNPITRGLAAVFDMSGRVPVDVLSRYSGSAANYTRAASSAGVGLKKNNANVDGQRSILGANPNSAIVISAPTSIATIKPFFSQRPAAGGGQYTFAANMDVGFAASAGTLTLSTNGVVQMTSSAAITGSTAMYGYSLTSSSTGQLYVNGAPVTTSTTNTGYPTITGPDFNVLSHTSTAAFNDTTTPLLVLWNRALTDAEHKSLAANPWQIFLDEDEETEALFPVAAAGGTTVTCTVGDEAEAGPSAAIALSTAFTTSVYTETEAGPSATITLPTSFTTTVGAETEAGPSATIALSTAFTTTVGAEVEAGLTATISGDLNIALSVANENEAGIIATVAVSTQVNCVIGNEAEAGLSATITNGVTVVCTVSNEQEVGLGATITASGGSSTGTSPWYQLAHKRGKR